MARKAAAPINRASSRLDLIEPRDEAGVAQAVMDAAALKLPLDIKGGGTRSGLGRPRQSAHTLSLRRLSGITLHEPAEMVLGAWAGTPLKMVEETLAAKGQMLPFEPMDHRAIYGTDGEPTIGGVVAANLSGPRRVIAGACRDSLIGVRFVNGKGEIIKSGGRVMKNVTGLDLVKLQAGAHGTLGVLTEVIFKVLPRPPARATLVYKGLSAADGLAVLQSAFASPFEPSAGAFLPAGLVGDESQTLLRVETLEEQIAYRLSSLETLTDNIATPSRITGAEHDDVWRDVRDARFLAEPREHMLWRISLPAGAAVRFLESVLATNIDQRHYCDWAGGLIWLSTEDDALAVHQLAAAAGGHAMLVRGSDGRRAAGDVMQPLAAPLMVVQKGLKAAFDPAGILNTGRLYAEF
jgi:glycolate oxidase FAD binding subunit